MTHVTTPSLSMDNYFTTTLTAPVLTSDTVISIASVPTASEGYLEIDEGLSTKEIIYYTSKGANFVTCPDATSGSGRGVGGTSVSAHSSGATVKQKVTAEYWKELQNGDAFKPSFIKDSNNNELLKFTGAGSAVNEITVTNAATAAGPTLTATGDDTNIWFKAAGKGTGFFLPQAKILSATITNTGTTEAVAATLTVPSIPFATNVLIMGWAYASLGSGAPTQDWQNFIRRGTTTGGTQLAFSNSTKSAANAVTEQRNISMMYLDTVAASTSTSYVWTVATTVSTATSGQFIALVTAQ
jgi:hypothetical protein